MKISEQNTPAGLKSLKEMQKNDYLKFIFILDEAFKIGDFDALDFNDWIKAGFTPDEASAAIFICAQDVCGREITEKEMFDKWFFWNK